MSDPLLIRSRGPHHLSYIINHTTTRHHQHNQQQQQQQPISQRRYEHTLSPIWPEPRQSHWSHQPKPSSHGSVISLSSIAITPPPSQLYTLHCTTTLCMSHTNSSFPNRLPCSGSKSSSSSSTSKQRCLVCLSYCTAQLHVLQSSIRLASLHLPIHHLSSSFQLQNLLPSLHCSPGEPRWVQSRR